MPVAKIAIEPVTVALESSLYVGSGFGYGLVDAAAVCDARGHPYIPGSSIKGRVRQACEGVARTHGLYVCEPPYPGRMCGNGESRRCIVCRVFGNPGGSEGELERLHWDNAYLLSSWSEAAGDMRLTCARTQVGISRTRGVAREGLLFSQQFATRLLSFATAITGSLWLTPVAGEKGVYYELMLLLAGLHLVDSLGGRRSGGAGRCRLLVPAAVLVRSDEGEQRLEVSRLLGDLDLLELYDQQVEAGET
ncbi:MAG: RAMP superfamily CRISPR-associated protein [Bacillota bacterium]